jgi:hypothetical protein
VKNIYACRLSLSLFPSFLLSFFPLSNIEALHFVIMNDFNELMQIETKIGEKETEKGRGENYCDIFLLLMLMDLWCPSFC